MSHSFPGEEPTEIRIVREAYDSWSASDTDGVMALSHPDVVYVLHLDPEVVPLGGVHTGADAFRAMLDSLRATFTYLRFERSKLTFANDVVQFRVSYSFLHKASRQILSGHYRAEVRVRDERIIRIEEFPDSGFVEAFFRATAAVAATPKTDEAESGEA